MPSGICYIVAEHLNTLFSSVARPMMKKQQGWCTRIGFGSESMARLCFGDCYSWQRETRCRK
jgi:hypothetical protein